MSRLVDDNLMIEISKLYYQDNLTQAQIAKKLNISRSLISKTLTKARAAGIVEITIHTEVLRPYKEMEDHLKQLLGIKHVRIVDDKTSETQNLLAKEANSLLKSKLASAEYVVVSGGSTITAMANAFSSSIDYPKLTFIPASGGIGELISESDANNVAANFASRCGAQYSQIYAPICVDSEVAKDILKRQYFIQNIFENARKASIAVLGIGTSFSLISMMEDYPKQFTDSLLLEHNKVCGDINFNYFDENGEWIDCPWNRQTINLTLEDLQYIPDIIIVASGVSKSFSIYTAAKKHYFNSLVIDAGIAKKLLTYYYKEPF